MQINPSTRTVSFQRSTLAADLARATRGKITAIDDVIAVAHLAIDRVLALTSVSEQTREEIHDHLDRVGAFLVNGTEPASLSLRIGGETYTADLS